MTEATPTIVQRLVEFSARLLSCDFPWKVCRAHVEADLGKAAHAMKDAKAEIERLQAALQEIATGASGKGARVDVAVMQTIARKALGEIES